MTNPELKTRALRLLIDGAPAWAVADQLGIARALVFAWHLEVRQAACDAVHAMIPDWLRFAQDDHTAAEQLCPGLFRGEGSN